MEKTKTYNQIHPINGFYDITTALLDIERQLTTLHTKIQHQSYEEEEKEGTEEYNPVVLHNLNNQALKLNAITHVIRSAMNIVYA